MGEDGEDALEEGETPPELLVRENEAFGMQYKAKQKIVNDAKRKALVEQMKVNPCHNCRALEPRILSPTEEHWGCTGTQGPASFCGTCQTDAYCEARSRRIANGIFWFRCTEDSHMSGFG